MRYLNLARHWFWLAPIAFGIVFIGGGVYMISEGRSAHNEVRDAILRENITTAEDAAIPNVVIDSPAEAKAQADVIEKHYLGITEGKTYSELDREDPNRETAFRAASLRTSLNLAVMGFKVSDLVVGMGAFMIVIGVTNALFLAPAVYWAAEVASQRERTESGKTSPATPAPQA